MVFEVEEVGDEVVRLRSGGGVCASEILKVVGSYRLFVSWGGIC